MRVRANSLTIRSKAYVLRIRVRTSTAEGNVSPKESMIIYTYTTMPLRTCNNKVYGYRCKGSLTIYFFKACNVLVYVLHVSCLAAAPPFMNLPERERERANDKSAADGIKLETEL